MDNKAQWSLVAAAWVLAIGVIGLGIFAIRHFSALRSHEGPPQIQSFGTAARPLCPVDRDEVAALPGTPHVNFAGTLYYFCDHKDPAGRSHKMLFLMDPMLYLTGVSGFPTPGAAAAAPGAGLLATPRPLSAAASALAVSATATATRTPPAP